MPNRLLRSIALKIPALRQLVNERNALRARVESLSRAAAVPPTAAALTAAAPDDWADNKRRKEAETERYRQLAPQGTMTPRFPAIERHLDMPQRELVRRQVEAEPYWFQRIEVLPGLFSPGWSNPATDKLPYYGLPDDLSGLRVLDIGCAEGFFSFEAERRGAREVIGIDSFPDSIRRFNIVKTARQSNAQAYLMNVYDLEPKRLGTFDVVLFYGVFYHLKHPQYALERIRSVCTGRLLFQTHMLEEPSVRGTPWARYYPHGMLSGPHKEHFDPTVFWLFNSACCLAMLDHCGFVDLRVISTDPDPFVVAAAVTESGPGVPPNQAEAPWC